MSKRSFLSQLLLRLLAVTGLFLIMNGTVCMLSQTFDASIHRERAVLFFGIAAVLITVVSMIDRRKAAVIGHIAILCVLALFVWVKYRALMNSARSPSPFRKWLGLSPASLRCWRWADCRRSP